MSKNYNLTELKIAHNLERGYYHSDFMAHFFRWNNIVKRTKAKQDTIIDFGCGEETQLPWVLYVNRTVPKKYIGIDLKKPAVMKSVADGTVRVLDKEWIEFIQDDLCNPKNELPKGDIVVSFEVIEHVGKSRVNTFLQNFKNCGNENAIYYLSTPNCNGSHAGNHTYDANDGHGKMGHEFYYKELKHIIKENGFKIIDHYGTFANQADYKEELELKYPGLLEKVTKHYHSTITSILLAPVVHPQNTRNIVWVLKKDNQQKLF